MCVCDVSGLLRRACFCSCSEQACLWWANLSVCDVLLAVRVLFDACRLMRSTYRYTCSYQVAYTHGTLCSMCATQHSTTAEIYVSHTRVPTLVQSERQLPAPTTSLKREQTRKYSYKAMSQQTGGHNTETGRKIKHNTIDKDITECRQNCPLSTVCRAASHHHYTATSSLTPTLLRCHFCCLLSRLAITRCASCSTYFFIAG